MQRSRSSEMAQRQSPRGPLQLRTSSLDSDPTHHPHVINRSPKAGGDRPSPKGALSNSVNQKKLGARIADLESQLGQAQHELKTLKDQLSTAEAAKKEAQEELQKKTKNPVVPGPALAAIQAQHPPMEVQAADNESQLETDVFEVRVESDLVEPRLKLIGQYGQVEKEGKQAPVLEKHDEISFLKLTLGEKEKELELCHQEKESLKQQLTEAALEVSSARGMEKEMASRLGLMGEELGASKANAAQLSEKLEAIESAKEALEAEMKKLSVQTEQWRKAADAAAAVLAAGVEEKGAASNRCGSMDKNFGGDYPMLAGSPGRVDDINDGLGGGKRRSGGMRRFGELWKKKVQKS